MKVIDKDGGIAKAVIDRFEGDYAVVLFGDKEVEIDIPLELLPEGMKEGSWLNVFLRWTWEGRRSRKRRSRDCWIS